MSQFSIEYYEEIRGKLHGLLFAVADNLPPENYAYIMEMIESNELGLSLEILVEDLDEADLPIARDVLEGLDSLSETMKMDYDVNGPLGRLARD